MIEGFVSELKCTVRECIDCGCLVPGGPTRCKRCASLPQSPAPSPTPETDAKIYPGMYGSRQWVLADVCRKMERERDEARKDLRERSPVAGLYYELLYAVERKFADESRHETALRYIRQAEEMHTEPCVESTPVR